MSVKLFYAVLTNEHWDNARIFAAATQHDADAEAWAYARACWAEWNEDSDEAWNDELDSGECPWVVTPANMHG